MSKPFPFTLHNKVIHLRLLPGVVHGCGTCYIKQNWSQDADADDRSCAEAGHASQKAVGQTCLSAKSVYEEVHPNGIQGTFQRYERLPDGKHLYTFITEQPVAASVVRIHSVTIED